MNYKARSAAIVHLMKRARRVLVPPHEIQQALDARQQDLVGLIKARSSVSTLSNYPAYVSFQNQINNCRRHIKQLTALKNQTSIKAPALPADAVLCPNCGRVFSQNGVLRHLRKCLSVLDRRARS